MSVDGGRQPTLTCNRDTRVAQTDRAEPHSQQARRRRRCSDQLQF